MKSFAKLICIGVALAGMQTLPAVAATNVNNAHKRVVVKPHLDKVDKAAVEKRMEDRGLRSKKRSEQASKAAQERQQKNLANPPKK